MSAPALSPIDPSQVLAIIMGGGQGTRLFPLTLERSKPAVPLAGKYRLVDIPISNCINSGMRRIYLLTQFNSASLHRHVHGSFKFDSFSRGSVEILAAEQTPKSDTWYQGTADAVRKNISHLETQDFEYLMILSGDQLYRMDFREILAQHVRTDAELTVATIPVSRRDAGSFGIMQIASDRKIARFVEKPREEALLDELMIPRDSYTDYGINSDEDLYLASMGIYVFNRDIAWRMLDNQLADFGKHIIPQAIEERKVYSYIYQGYWEDIGTIRAFFEANLELTSELPRFNFFDMEAPIYTRPRFLPSSKINGAAVDHAVISDGCILNHCQISHSVIGLRTRIDRGAKIDRAIIMGADYYESQDSIDRNAREGYPRIGVGCNTRIENAIVDKNARIGENCVISPSGKPRDYEGDDYYVRDGILIVPKAAVIHDGTVL